MNTYRMRRIEEFLNLLFFFHLKYSKIEEGVWFTLSLAHWLAQPLIDRLDASISIVIVGATAAEVRVNHAGKSGGGVELHWRALFLFLFFLSFSFFSLLSLLCARDHMIYR